MSLLAGHPPEAFAEILREHSGLPGPRANLALADEFATIATPAQIREFASSPDEYLALCGAIGLGVLFSRGDDTVEELRRLASDDRWRVREGVARGLQDVPAERLVPLITRWADDADPLVQRAAIAGICEPRLLKAEPGASAALAACETTTRSLLERTDRHDPGVRVLRQALGYCWSVAIAASPRVGLASFAELQASPDADAQWIVRENLKKARLAKLL